MKSFLSRALVCAVLLPAAALAASFEGKFAMKIATEGRAQDMTYLVKGDKLRMEMIAQGQSIAALIEPAKRQATLLLDAQKMAMVMTLPDSTASNPKSAGAPKLEATGETEKIFGYTAEKYVVTHESGKTHLWLAEGLGSFITFNPNSAWGGAGGSAPAQEPWERALAGRELFPLRLVSHDKSGHELSRMEVTAVEKQPLADSLFTVPADYRTMDMGGMMKGMMPAGR